MKRIDFEAHCYSPAAIDCFSRRDGYPYYRPEEKALSLSDDLCIKNELKLSRLTQNCEERIELMDRFGTWMQILSSSPGIELLDDVRTATEVARETNDWMASFIKKYPKRFKAFAVLPVQDPEASSAELERCMKELGFTGWMAYSNFGLTYPDDDRYASLFDKAGELGAAVYMHPTHSVEPGGRLTGLGPHMVAAAFGFGIDTSIAIMRLILKGTFDRNPGLKLMVGHLGEIFPFILKRMVGMNKINKHEPAVSKELPDYYFRKNIWVTTSGQFSHESFRCTADVLGIDHILFGSDFPYESLEEIDAFNRELVLSDLDKEKLFFRNAEEYFGIKL
ncbi:MAG: amidohydrolase family protein [Oscillospiraceae bacterium]|nr:amidohydrolase family protein [Oscillospiraceae bacterium]